uniref:Uncharacterized protein n=1 Tax=virus sp. ct1Uu26 TaxID=2826789 RepID=A0A8S5R801_9VIRU|nr:MAG TPA: hypothetical protein [virus sp. ct1Uu26]
MLQSFDLIASKELLRMYYLQNLFSNYYILS